MNKSNDQIAQGGHDLWRVAGSQPGAIFPEGHITDVMERILSAPMISHQLQKVRRRGQMRREHDEQVDEHVEWSCRCVAQ